MTNPDYRAMCAELVRRWDAANADLVARARALLAQPESIQDRIATADAAIEASMERIRALAAPARAALAEREAKGPVEALK